MGTIDLTGFPGEKVTEGLDGLRDRLNEYVGLGLRFAKWRAVISIGNGIPTDTCITIKLLIPFAPFKNSVALG
jgi:fructose-bisphosphate aldolase class I